MQITDIGLQKIILAQASNSGFQLNITDVKLGGGNTDIGSGATDVPGGIVYELSSSQVKYSYPDAKTILLELTLDESVGDFTYGSVGVYLDTGELFAYDIFELYPKRATSLPSIYGDTHKRYYAITCQDISSAVTISFNQIVPSELPTVNTSGSLPAANAAPNLLYLVKSAAAFNGGPALAYTNGTTWFFSSLNQNGFSAFKQSSTFTGTPAATGSNAVAVGNAEADGSNSIALGASKVIGNNSHVGSTTTAVTTYGDHHVVLGDRNSGGQSSSRNHNTIIGGSQNSSQADYTAAFGSEGAKLNADYSTATGKRPSTTTVGELAHAVGMFSREGDAQHSHFIFKVITTATTPTELFADAADLLTVEESSAMFMRGTLFMVRTAPSIQTYAWDVFIRVENIANAITRTVTLTPRPEYPTPATATLTTSVDNSNDNLRFFVTAESTNPTRWVLDLQATRIMW